MFLNEINLRDPFILADNGKYYLYGTGGSKNFGENFGFSVFVSEDLVHWSEPKTVFGRRRYTNITGNITCLRHLKAKTLAEGRRY